MINWLFLVIGFLILSITHLSAATPAQVGTPLNASNGTWSGNPTSWTYQWNHCATPPNSNCTAITNNSTSQSYTPVTGDIGDTITVAVTAHNTVGASLPSISVATAVVTAASGICLGVHDPNVNGFDPNAPNLSGYNLVFDSEFNNFNDIDMTCNSQPSSGGCQDPAGKNWYVNSWTFPNAINLLSDYTITNGVMRIQQDIHTGNWALSTMGPHAGASHGASPWMQNWNGLVFTGGMYAEARIAGEWTDQNNNVVQPGFEVGAFWTYNSDRMNSGVAQWPGQAPGYLNFAEYDIMEKVAGQFFYLTTMHQWYGPGGSIDLNAAVGNTILTQNTNRTTFHIFGMLWVPATATTNGFIQNFYDGVPTRTFSWSLYNPNAAPPPTGSQIGNIIDQDHMQIILGADPVDGTLSPTNPRGVMYVDWVHVWQLAAAATASLNTTITPQANFTGGNGSCP